MAYRDFTVGQVLTSQQVDEFLMRQTVMVFADSAARTTALSSVLAEGMFTFLTGTNEFQYYSGSAWVDVSNPGDITGVTAGTALTGGGTTGDVTLNVDLAAITILASQISDLTATAAELNFSDGVTSAIQTQVDAQIPKSTVTTAQDLIVADGASSVTRLGVGTDDQVLSVVAGEVAWADAAGGAGGNYYNITSVGTYTVSLAAGLYGYASTAPVTVGGVSLNGSGLENYTSTVTSITAPRPDWTSRSSGFGTTYIYGVGFGDGLYLAVGNSGTLTTSPDGITWTSRTSGFGSTGIRDVTYGDGLYVAVARDGKLSSSPDGITWTSRTSGFGSGAISAVTYGDSLFVAVGDGGALTTSIDGTTWTTRTSGFGTSVIYGVTYGDGLYVAVGDTGKLTTSTDGITWTSRTSGFGTTRIYGVTYGDGLYVAVGLSGTLTTSTDGTTWTTRTSGFGTTGINGVTYGDGLYVAVGDSGTLTTSTDGTTWTTRTSGFGTTRIWGVTYGDGLYLAVGESGKLTTQSFSTIYLALELKSPVTTLS